MEDGSEIIIASNDSKFACGTISSGIGAKVDVTASNGVIADPSTAVVFTVKKNEDSTYSFMVGNQYLSSTSTKNISLVSDGSKANAKWTISLSTGGIATVTNSASNIGFTTYTSSQKLLTLFKASGTTEKTTYTYSNVYLRYGTGLSKELYDALLEEGTTVSFGVAVSIDGTNYTNYTFNPVRVAEIGAKTESSDGEFYQFFAVMPVAAANYTTVVSAKCFVTIDGVTYFSKSAAYSVETLVEYYISNANVLGLSAEQVAILGGF